MNSASDMKCRVCGRGNLESAQFCGSCGAKLRSRSMIDRMIGASLLDVRTYEDVEGDTSANFILGGIISRMNKERSRTGIRGSMARMFVKFVTKKERT